MRQLILGGTRFIGRALVRRLVARGDEVHVLSRHAALASAEGAHAHEGDRRDAKALAEAARGDFDTVFDFLGMDGGDARLAAAAFRTNCRRFVHLSTGSVYWVAQASRCPWIESDDNLALRDRAGADAEEFDYGVAKREAEAVYRAAAQHGLPLAIVRAPVVSGPGDWRRRDLYWVRRILSGRPCLLPDGGANVFNHVYVDDLVELLIRIGEDGNIVPGTAFNAADRIFTTLRGYLSWFGEVIGRKPVLVDLPRASLPKGLSDRSFFFADTKSHVLDNRRAESAFGPIFRTPEEWIPPTVAWCQAQPSDPADEPRLAAEQALAESA
jgi:dTDP-glucose 4,6-dehydratase